MAPKQRPANQGGPPTPNTPPPLPPRPVVPKAKVTPVKLPKHVHPRDRKPGEA
jgi:hypothetical protein